MIINSRFSFVSVYYSFWYFSSCSLRLRDEFVIFFCLVRDHVTRRRTCINGKVTGEKLIAGRQRPCSRSAFFLLRDKKSFIRLLHQYTFEEYQLLLPTPYVHLGLVCVCLLPPSQFVCVAGTTPNKEGNDQVIKPASYIYAMVIFPPKHSMTVKGGHHFECRSSKS